MSEDYISWHSYNNQNYNISNLMSSLKQDVTPDYGGNIWYQSYLYWKNWQKLEQIKYKTQRLIRKAKHNIILRTTLTINTIDVKTNENSCIIAIFQKSLFINLHANKQCRYQTFAANQLV